MFGFWQSAIKKQLKSAVSGETKVYKLKFGYLHKKNASFDVNSEKNTFINTVDMYFKDTNVHGIIKMAARVKISLPQI